MKIRILAPEATLGDERYESGDELEVKPENIRAAARLIRSGYAIDVEDVVDEPKSKTTRRRGGENKAEEV